MPINKEALSTFIKENPERAKQLYELSPEKKETIIKKMFSSDTTDTTDAIFNLPKKEAEVPDVSIERQNVFGEAIAAVPAVQAIKGVGAIVDKGNVAANTNREAVRANPMLAPVAPIAGTVALTGMAGEGAKSAAASSLSETSPTFQDQILGKYYDNDFVKMMPQTTQFLIGNIPSAAGLIADMYSNPLDMALEIASQGSATWLKGLDIANDAKKSLFTALKQSDELKKQKKFTDVVIDGMNKAVRKTVRGKGTAKKVFKSNNDLVVATDAILDNADDIKYVDNVGNIVGQGKPESLPEMLQAVDQTKAKLFQEWTALKKDAGSASTLGIVRGKTTTGKGLIQVDDIATQMRNDVAGREFDTLYKGVKEKVYGLADELDSLNHVTVEEADSIVKRLNSELDTFYRSGAPIESLPKEKAYLAHVLNQRVDDFVSQGTKEYSGLRRKYGALKEIEKDLTNRVVVNARRNPSGFFDIADTYTYGQIARGVLTGNPGALAQGTVGAIAKAWIKRSNDPNMIIKKTFQVADDLKRAKPSQVKNITAKTLDSISDEVSQYSPRVASGLIASMPKTLTKEKEQ